QKLKLLSFPVDKCEYQGVMPKGFLMKYSNALARLAIHQLHKLDRFNRKRVSIARKYGKTIPGAIYLRYPLQLKSRNIIVKIARKKGILFGNWYHNVIDPADCYLLSVGYTPHLCPNAEKLAEGIVNLPTHPRMRNKDVEKIKNFVSRYSHPER
ncbi:MAG: DegT/DnrJ/EryC1/StrS family aminotransferase, partial [Candidatus Roizmanbacteria bacterium]|nr:DegT/DnrJ/EryC1/StrS family aminotransferase [Candidatus Roizmanbacteria bacterium]